MVVGLDAEATARVLGKRAGAVRTAAWRGLRRLAAQLDREAARRERSSDGTAALLRRPVTESAAATPEDMT